MRFNTGHNTGFRHRSFGMGITHQSRELLYAYYASGIQRTGRSSPGFDSNVPTAIWYMPGVCSMQMYASGKNSPTASLVRKKIR